MQYNIFSLQPNIFESFFNTSLVARAVSKNIISYELINWREEFGKGNYKQVDDRPVGGGGGMVLQTEPIFSALKKYSAVSSLFNPPEKPQLHSKIYPNNQAFFDTWQNNPSDIKSVTILLTPRGFNFNQKTASWLANNFDNINLVCGRYEGFDSRVSEAVDLEISLGDFVLNGGEVASLSLIEAVSRLLPSFMAKENNYAHESFSELPNFYPESWEFVVGSNNLKNKKISENSLINNKIENLFSNLEWSKKLTQIEHPQYTKPLSWQNWLVPEILSGGNHKSIQNWRENWYKTLSN